MVEALIATITSLSLLSGAAAPAGQRQRDIRAALQQGEVVPLKRILDAALTRVPGDVSKVELAVERHRLIYEVKIIDRRGAISELLFDARTGAYIGMDED